MTVFRRVTEGEGCCPVCGAKLAKSLLIADLTTNTLSFQGLRWRTTPKVTEFLHTLIEAYPKPVSHVVLMDALYGIDADKKPYALLGQYAWHINVMLMPLSLKVYNMPNKFYRLGPTLRRK